MKVVFLPSASPDLRWFTRYYRFVFPQGRSTARRRGSTSARSTSRLLSENPGAGKPLSDSDQRELVILETPFVLLYRIGASEIEILRLRDARADQAARTFPDEAADQ